jgi:Holliday junction resolvase
MKEAEIQFQIIKYLEANQYYVVKIIQSNKNGWPDLQAHKNGQTIFIEVKSEKGKLSELQKYRLKKLQEKGFICIIAHSLKNFINELHSSISVKLPEFRPFDNLN